MYWYHCHPRRRRNHYHHRYRRRRRRRHHHHYRVYLPYLVNFEKGWLFLLYQIGLEVVMCWMM